jgi:citrate synthase
MTAKRIRSDIAQSSADRIVVRGHDLTELIGTVSLGDMAFLELTGRLPAPNESTVFNAITVTLVEHGLTPSAIATRMTLLGAPESLQGAVAAGLLGLGDRFGGPVENAARMLQEAGDRTAAAIVAAFREKGRPVPGVGHPQHTEADPRVARLFEVAAANGLAGRHVELMREVGEEATRQAGRRLPVNATGAIGAVASELGLDWHVCRGLAVMARAIGLVAHVQEEMQQPIARAILERIEEEAES